MKKTDINEETEMEQWNDVKKGQNTSSVFIVILVILLIAACTAGFLYGDKLYALVHKTEEENTKTEEKTNNEEKEEEAKEETKEEIQPLDLSKCLNCGENWVITDPKEEDDGTSNFTLTNDNNHVTLTIHWSNFCKASGSSECDDKEEVNEVKNIGGKVIDTIVGGSGQSISSTTFYYLLNNGKVEYTKLYSRKDNAYELNRSYDYDSDGKVTDTYFSSQGTVPNVENIIKLYNVQVHVENSSGHATTIGALADGSFYDLKVD